MLNPIFLEVANGVLTSTGLVLVAVFVRYLLDDQSTERGRLAARAIAVFVFGETIFRGWIWLWRHQVNDGGNPTWMHHYPVAAIGMIITIIGAFCMLRVFSHSTWPWWLWVGIIGAAIALASWIALW